MSPKEKTIWLLLLWYTSVASALMLGLALAGGVVRFPTVFIWAWLGITLLAWLFRITYLAGAKR